jgi:hypothetical protein
VEEEFVGDRVTMEVREVVDHYGDFIVRARYDGTYDKTNLPDELVMSGCFSVCDEQILASPASSTSRRAIDTGQRSGGLSLREAALSEAALSEAAAPPVWGDPRERRGSPGAAGRLDSVVAAPWPLASSSRLAAARLGETVRVGGGRAGGGCLRGGAHGVVRCSRRISLLA